MRARTPSLQAQAILRALLQSNPAWRHGYDLSRETEVASGTLYPLLIRLTERGLLESEWRESEPVGKPPRHVYRLSPQGVELAQSLAASPGVAVRQQWEPARQ